MGKSNARFFALSLVLFLCFASVECQWGFGLGKGGGWDWLWSNVGELDKFDLNQNRDTSGGVVIPKQQQTSGQTSLRRRYGRFVQSADSSAESSDSSSEEIAVGDDGNIHSSYLGEASTVGFNDVWTGPQGDYNEGEEQVNNGNTGTGSGTGTTGSWQFNDNSGSGKSTWNENDGNAEEPEDQTQTPMNQKPVTYDKRSLQTTPGQQGQGLPERQQGSQGQNRGQNGWSGPHRFRSWADYQRHNNQGEEYEPEDMTTVANYNGGRGQTGAHGQGETEAEDIMPQSGGRSPTSAGYEGVEAEDRTTSSTFSSKKTTPEQEYEAEDVTTSAPGGSVTSGRVTYHRTTTEEYELEGNKPTTVAPKVPKQRKDTWESGMNPGGRKSSQTAQRGTAPGANSRRPASGPDSRGRWVDIGQMPYPQRRNNTVDKNGWTAYASSVDNSDQRKGTQPQQSWVNVKSNERQPSQGHIGRTADPVVNRPGNGPSPGNTWVVPKQKPAEVVPVGSWFDTLPASKNMPQSSTNPKSPPNNQLPGQGSSGNLADSRPSPARPVGRGSSPTKQVGRDPSPTRQVGRGPSPTKPVGRGPSPTKPVGRGPSPTRQVGRGPSPTRQVGRGPSPVTPAFQSQRNPTRRRPLFPNRQNQIVRPTSSNGQKPQQGMTSSFPVTRNRPSTPNKWRQQPVRTVQPGGTPEQTARKPSWTTGSPNDGSPLLQDGWVNPPTIQTNTPQQPTQNVGTKPDVEQWNNGQNNKAPGRVEQNRNSQRKPLRNPNKPNNEQKQPAHGQKKPETNIVSSKQPSWKIVHVSPTLQIVEPKAPEQAPKQRGQNQHAWSDPASDLAGRHPVQRNNLPNEKRFRPTLNQREQPVFKDINSVRPSKPGTKGRHTYPNDISRNPSPGKDIVSPVVGKVTEKPIMEVSKVSKGPDTGHVTVGLKLDVSDASVPNLQVNNWGNNPQRGDFVYQPKPARVPKGHKPKGSRNTNMINNPHRVLTISGKPNLRKTESSTFKVINPNKETSHTSPAITRPTNKYTRPWNQDNSLQPAVKQAPEKGNKGHMKQMENLINKQHPSTVIKQFIEMTTESTLRVADSRGTNGLITNIDNTLSSDSTQVINLLRGIAQANQRPSSGHHEKGVPRNDVIAKMSSTAVLGNHPNTIDMAPGHGSIVDGVDAEVLLNSNANIHGIINSKTPGLSKPSPANSIIENPKLERTKSKTPYPRTNNKMHFGEQHMAVRRVDAEARPIENTELGQTTNVNSAHGSSKSVITIINSQQTSRNDNIGQSVRKENRNIESTIQYNKGNKQINNELNGSAKTNNIAQANSAAKTTSSSWSENNPDLSEKGVNTEPVLSKVAQTGSKSDTKTNGGRQAVSVNAERTQTAPVAHRQFQTALRAQRRRQGGDGTWRGGRRGLWEVAARNEARELVLEKEGHWNSLSHGTRDQKLAKSNSRHRSG